MLPVELVVARLRHAAARNTTGLNFENSNYQILENIKSGIGEWNSIIGGNNVEQPDRRLHAPGREPRRSSATLFPFVDILDGAARSTPRSASSRSRPNNELRYNTFQVQDNFTRFRENHSLTFGGSVEKYHSENVFFPGEQSVYVYNSLADFYTDANDYLANPNRTTSPVTLAHVPGALDTTSPGMEKPLQPLDVWYTGVYAQDEWQAAAQPDGHRRRARRRRRSSATPAIDNANADALTFRDENGNAVQYKTAQAAGRRRSCGRRASASTGT